ncbi:MAG: serine dehydratase subunit alpha family protein [Oscillospiraceae bacterium]|nr:serine dehydratase subunit alpha family protein [Oscillospiraceae bacterium]
MLAPATVDSYIEVLRSELLLATGCTEPIAIAYAGALLRKTMACLPERVKIEVSGNIIKNVKSVIVPNTGRQKGIRAAVAAGLVAGDPEAKLQVISAIPKEKHADIAEYARGAEMEIICADTPWQLDILLTGYAGEHVSSVRIAKSHANVVHMERDGKVLFHKELSAADDDGEMDKSFMSVADILEFAETVDLSRVSDLLDRQIDFNTAIAEDGLQGDWGANIGSILLKEYPADIKTEAKAWAAAGSDARMSGCERPVVIVSGSGNQGMTASLPVIRYALHLGVPREKLYRALLVSNLVTIHQKSGIGRLSAYCGAVSAGVGAGAGIAYLLDGSFRAIAHTVVNAVAILSGTICDGAKPSCAAKIAATVDAGILGYQMYCNNKQFRSGDGIVTKGVDDTIANIGVLAKQGMQETDRVILEIMTKRCR